MKSVRKMNVRTLTLLLLAILAGVACAGDSAEDPVVRAGAPTTDETEATVSAAEAGDTEPEVPRLNCVNPASAEIKLVLEEPSTAASVASISGWHWMTAGSEDRSDFSESAARRAAAQLVGLGLDPAEPVTLCLYEGGAGVGPPRSAADQNLVTEYRVELVRSNGEQLLLSGFGERPVLPSESDGLVELGRQTALLYPEALDEFNAKATLSADEPDG